MEKLSEEVGELQERLYAAGQNSVLIVLQGMDTSGKDGTIKQRSVGSQSLGCRIESFKVPTEEELSRDSCGAYTRLCRAGIMTIFNRSHYEDVVVVRVHELAPQSTWQRRYQHITISKRLLFDSATIVLNFIFNRCRRAEGELEAARARR